MQEKNLPTPVTPDMPVQQSAEVNVPINTEAIDTPIVSTPEKVNSAGDRVNQSGPTGQSVIPLNLPQPIQQTPLMVTSDDDEPSSTTNPVVADDVDVIEKAWVQKAKKIVNQTKSDPHLQEEEVSRLQTDYQLKRFGETASGK